MSEPKKRELLVKRISNGEIVERLDMTGKDDRIVEKTMRGMLINMNTDAYFIHDTGL